MNENNVLIDGKEINPAEIVNILRKKRKLTEIISEYLLDKILEEVKLSQEERAKLLEDFKIENDEVDELIAFAKENVKDSTSLYEFTRDINDSFSAEQRIQLIESMWKIAYADGNIDKYEEHIIRKVSNLIYVAHSDFIKAKISAKEQI